MRYQRKVLLSLFSGVLIFLLASDQTRAAEFFADIELGLAYTGYNDIRIPGDTGTDFSLSDDLSADETFAYRVHLGAKLTPRNTVFLLAAPLTVRSSGSFDRDVDFNGQRFRASDEITAHYRFDSYRLTWRYRLFEKSSFTFEAGLTGKIRDASILLEGEGVKSEKKNTGFVPLINFKLNWSATPTIGLEFSGDALAGPQGRAEDILFAVLYKARPHITFYTGYRLLEGGADNDEVYTFSLFHYFVAGFRISR